jgi:endonuclease/exonuclease/phosphatase family metal-dependent hydrolase
MSFRLIAAWPYLSERLEQNPIVEAVDKWSDWLKGHDVVVAGDFNTGGRWVKSEPSLDHRLVVDALGGIGLRSAYHTYWYVVPGVGELPTHWNSRYGPLHIDHVLAPDSWPIRDVQVGPPDPWKARSDHAPVLVDYAAGP